MLSERLTRFNTQPPKGGWLPQYIACASQLFVSTHSRLKAAGLVGRMDGAIQERFNTQPPKGGWKLVFKCKLSLLCFNTQPPKGGWGLPVLPPLSPVCFNTQPPKGGWAVIPSTS